MSYVVSIVRQDPSNRHISIDEWRAEIEADPDLRIESDTAECLVAEWLRPQGKQRAFFSYSDGQINAFSPDDSTLEKMQKVARAMNGTLIGEGGENLMDEHGARGGCLAAALFTTLGFRLLLERLHVL